MGTFVQKPVGTGPFLLKQFIPRQSITLVRNPNYWDHGLPYLDGMLIQEMALPAQIIAMRAGNVDLLTQAPLAATQVVLSNPQVVFSFAPSPLYRGPVVGDPDARPHSEASTDSSRWDDAQPDASSQRVPVPHTMPAQTRGHL
jgi:peptide/nickel transport system substrate-binding protein